jgi:subtilisin
MAQEKEERLGAGIKRTGEAADDSLRRTGTPGRAAPRESASAADTGVVTSVIGRRREPYLIGIRPLPGGQLLADPRQTMDEVIEYLSHTENVEIAKRMRLGGARPFAAGGRSVSEFVVAKIDETTAQRVRLSAPPHLIIEPDVLLSGTDCLLVPARVTPFGSLLPVRSVGTDISIRVLGERDQPVVGATVLADGGGAPAQALTDDTGTARITFFGGPVEAIQTLVIRAAANHWDRFIPAPRLGPGTNTIKLRPLSEIYPKFPAARLLGWGQRLMGIDPASGRFTGSGVRVGLIDSGCDSSHPLLRHVTQGRDFTPHATDAGWTHDLLSHGTHCAGIINASSTEQGVVGCAPAAELHVFKVIPQGRISDLLAALDECIERELDVVNIGVTCEGFSELLDQKLQEARRRGIACVVAAGNTGGPLGFPAMVPGVMAVAAVGKLREFPADSSHVLSVLPHLIGSDDIFAAAFSAAGPHVAVSAPGVAVVSTAPDGGYAAADRTAAAAAHVTGLAALIVAHHPAFQEGPFRQRAEQRVHALFELIRASAVPRFADPLRGGAGVPYLPRVPSGQSLAIGFAGSDGADRFAIPTYWPGPLPGWPAWASTAGLF